MQLLEEFRKNFEAILIRIEGLDLAGVSLGIAVLAMFVAILGRHRMTMVETMILVALTAALAQAESKLFAVSIAVLSLVHAVGGIPRRRMEERLRSVDHRLADLGTSVEGFVQAMDRRSREVDRHVSEREDRAVARVMETISDFAPEGIVGKPNGSGVGSAPAVTGGKT